MRLGPSDRRNVRRLLPRPFLSSPVILVTYLILILVCIGVLEWVLHTSAKAKETDSPQARSLQLHATHENTVRTTIEVVPVLVIRQNTSDGDGNGASDTSDGTPTTTHSSDSETTDEPDTTTKGSGSDTGTETNEPDTSTTEKPEPNTTTSEHGTETTETHESETTTGHVTTETTNDGHSTTTTEGPSTTTSEASSTTTGTHDNDDDSTNDDDPSGNHNNSDDSDGDSDDNDGSTSDSSSDTTSSTGNDTQIGFTSLFNDEHKPIPLANGNREMPTPVNKLVKFTANYATIIIAVFFQTIWYAIFASIKLYEPFHQLVQPGGAPPTTGMLFEFLQTGFPIDHFKAGFLGNWTSWYMITSYLISLLLLIIPSLATEAFSIQNVKGECIDSVKDKCARTVWTVSVKPVRTLEIALIVLAILVFAVTVYRIRRGMDVHLKRITLASISETLTDPRSVELLRTIPPHAPRREANLLLSRQNWALETSSTAEFGAVEPSYILRSTSERQLTKRDQAFGPLEKIVAIFTPHSQLVELIIPACIILFLMVIVGMYAGHGVDDSKLVSFFKSARFGPKFFLVGTVAILGLFVSHIEYEVRLMTIYRTLYTSSDPHSLLNRRLNGSPLTQTFNSLYHREWVCAFVSGMTGYGIPALAIVIGNVPWHPGQSVANAKGCIFASLALLILLASALGTVPGWRRGNVTLGMNKLPCTLGDIYVLMVHGNIPGIHGSPTDKELAPHGVPEYYSYELQKEKDGKRQQKTAGYQYES